MCIAIPKRIQAIETINDIRRATVVRNETAESVSLSMTPQAKIGDMVLVFQGNALRVVSESEAQQIDAALTCLGQALEGEMTEEGLRAGFGDLMDNPAQLPPHLQAQVGKKIF